MITKEQYEFYWKNGFLVVKDILTDEECDEAYEVIRQFADDKFSAIMNPDRVEYLLAQSLNGVLRDVSLSEKVAFIKNAKKASSVMRGVLRNKKAVKCLEELQGRTIVGLMTQMLFKEANSAYASQAWEPHQDNAYPRNENGQYITTNFFFRDADKENGSMYAYCGSHTEGLFESDSRESYREKPGQNPGNKIPQDILNKFEKVDLTFEKGDMLILHGNCIHGSYPNKSRDRSRPLLSCSYISKGEKFISGKNANRRVISLK